MNNTFESIQFNSNNPIKIFVHNLNYTQNHWHDALEILFVLDGNIQIGIGNSLYLLQKEDIIVINPNEIHTTSAQNANLVLALQISSDWIQENSTLKGIHLQCISCISGNPQHMNQIRKLLAQMMWVHNNQSECFELRLQSYLSELLYQLFVYFKAEKMPSLNENEKYMPRLSNIIYFLHANYQKDISLQELADKEYLSISYISRFFKKHIGIPYKEYVISLRLEHAVKDLLFTDKSITQLAFDNGFPNMNSFLDAFKDTYKELPSTYRKKAKADFQFLYGPNLKSNNYFEIVNLNIFSNLYKYLTWNQNNDISDNMDSTVEINFGKVDITEEATKVLHTWKNLLTIGKALDALNPVIQEQLSMVQKEIGFRYLRFHGIFDDEMKVYDEDAAGKPVINFTYIDQVLDFLCTIRLKPFIELSFMPELLAKNKHTVFNHRQSFISTPYDIQKWCYLINSFILHCMDRYGEKQVEEWYFEFWNEPDMTEMFWYDSETEYYTFYENTYKTIKSISKELQIGGPAICILFTMDNWLIRYFEFCKAQKCLPDFFTFHCYIHNASLAEINKSIHLGITRITLSSDPDYLKKAINHITELVSDFNYNTSNIHMTEWNASPSHRDLSRDTLFMASYIVKNILENMDTLSSFGYWTISDFIEEFPLPKESFHGGLGVITANGIKKAGYHAFTFLNLLGSNKIASGPGYYITSDTKGYQILLYNYCHYDPLYCSMDHSGISDTVRYGIFKDNRNKTMKISLVGFTEANYKIIEHTVNRSHGSAFDSWIDMGYPDIMTHHIDYLNSISIPHHHETIEFIKDTYLFERCLTPHEIRLIELTKFY